MGLRIAHQVANPEVGNPEVGNLEVGNPEGNPNFSPSVRQFFPLSGSNFPPSVRQRFPPVLRLPCSPPLLHLPLDWSVNKYVCVIFITDEDAFMVA